MKVLVLFIAIITSVSLFSQTIINAETLGKTNDSLVVSLGGSYSGTRGNSTTDMLQIQTGIVKRFVKNDFKLFGNYSILSTGTTSLLNSGYVHARHNYSISPQIKTFEFYQVQFNEVLLLTKREVVGGGLRYSFFMQDSVELDFGAGLMYENEMLNQEKLIGEPYYNSEFIRATTVLSFMWIVNSNVRIQNVTYFQPRIADLNDYRLLNDLQIKCNITKALAITATATIRYDSMPPVILEDYDSHVKMGVHYSFKR